MGDSIQLFGLFSGMGHFPRQQGVYPTGGSEGGGSNYSGEGGPGDKSYVVSEGIMNIHGRDILSEKIPPSDESLHGGGGRTHLFVACLSHLTIH